MSHAAPLPSLTVDEFVALNDEIAALARAGVPLESGLVAIASDWPGRVGATAAAIARRMEAGESLPQILDSADSPLPRAYKAVVAAGIRSGRLAAALEEISVIARRLAELRSAVGAAAVYPLVLCGLGALLFGWIVVPFVQTISQVYESYIPGPGPVDSGFLAALPLLAAVVAWACALLIVASAAWWVVARQGMAVDTEWSQRIFGWFPGMRSAVRMSRAAGLADLLSVLVRHGVPMHEAIILAADATGDAPMRSESNRLAEGIRGGRPAATTAAMRGHLPPLLAWLVAGRDSGGDLPDRLNALAASYRQRVERIVDGLRYFLPIFLTLAVGGFVGVLYALSVLGPYYALIEHFAAPIVGP